MSKFVEYFLVVMVAVVIVVLNAGEGRAPPDLDIRRKIDTTLLALQDAELAPSSAGNSLDILAVNVRQSAGEIRTMLRLAGGHGGVFLYSHPKIGTYTMSAQGVDGTQHLAHAYLQGFKPFAVENVMMPLYVLSQRKQYMLDKKQYRGRLDIWQSSKQAFYYPRGDCEDHAIALADWLIEMGEDARVVVGDWKGNGHAWVVLFKNGKEYLLEATQKSGLSRTRPYPVAALHLDYHPQYMFNRDYFWRNSGSKFTTDYSGHNWKKKSRYHSGA